VLRTICSFAENEGNGGENFLGTCFPASAPGEATSREQQQLADGRRAGRGGGGGECLEHSISFPTCALLRFLNVGRVEYMGRGKNRMASVLISAAPSDAQRMSSSVGTSPCSLYCVAWDCLVGKIFGETLL
jgi:hypothetical protein